MHYFIIHLGRQTLSRLSTYMAGLDLCEVGRRNEYTSTDWHKDLKTACIYAGAYHKLTAFLLPEELVSIFFKAMPKCKDSSFCKNIKLILT